MNQFFCIHLFIYITLEWMHAEQRNYVSWYDETNRLKWINSIQCNDCAFFVIAFNESIKGKIQISIHIGIQSVQEHLVHLVCLLVRMSKRPNNLLSHKCLFLAYWSMHSICLSTTKSVVVCLFVWHFGHSLLGFGRNVTRIL